MSNAVRIPQRWLRLLRALMGLPAGRFQVIISVWPTGLDYSIQPMGEIHVERIPVSQETAR